MRFLGHGAATISGGVPVGVPGRGPSHDGVHGWVVVPGMTAGCDGCNGEVWRATTPKASNNRRTPYGLLLQRKDVAQVHFYVWSGHESLKHVKMILRPQ